MIITNFIVQYILRKGFTGGWADLYCEHNYKYGSKMMVFKVRFHFFIVISCNV